MAIPRIVSYRVIMQCQMVDFVREFVMFVHFEETAWSYLIDPLMIGLITVASAFGSKTVGDWIDRRAHCRRLNPSAGQAGLCQVTQLQDLTSCHCLKRCTRAGSTKHLQTYKLSPCLIQEGLAVAGSFVWSTWILRERRAYSPRTCSRRWLELMMVL